MEYIKDFIQYKEGKGEKAIYRVNDNCGNTYYSDDYVKWMEHQLRLHSVSNSIATEYAEFCVRCDREKLPLLCLEDYIKQYCC